MATRINQTAEVLVQNPGASLALAGLSVTKGNTVFTCWRQLNNGVAFTGPTDPDNNTWELLGSNIGNFNAAGLKVYVCWNIRNTNSSLVITGNWANPCLWGGGLAIQYSGLNPNSLDQFAKTEFNGVGGNPTISTPNITTTANYELALAFCNATSGGNTYTIPSGGIMQTVVASAALCLGVLEVSLESITTGLAIIQSSDNSAVMGIGIFTFALPNAGGGQQQSAPTPGTPFTTSDGTVYALPAKRVLMTCITAGTLQISMDAANWQTVTLDSNKNAFITANFMRITGATGVVNVKHTNKKK